MKKPQIAAKLNCKILYFGLSFLVLNVFAYDSSSRLFIPFLDPASQSNVAVTVSDVFGTGQPCPTEYANIIPNPNLFNTSERKMLSEVLGKYQNVTTNFGPTGTVLVKFYQTNFVAQPLYWVKTNAYWMTHRTNTICVSLFQYTNSDLQEKITFGGGISAICTNKFNDGYVASINRTGDGSMLSFSELKHGSGTGVLVRFSDLHSQGTDWNYKRANFSDGHFQEYMQYTNGMLFGKWLMWDARSGNLTLEAAAKEPYDWNNHRTSLPIR